MTTDLREALSAAFEGNDNETPETPAAVQQTDELAGAAADTEVPAGSDGAGAGASEPTAAKPDATEHTAKWAADKPAEEQPLQPGQHRVDRAPASWKKEAKGEWAAVPLHIRQEVHRREIEINRALNEANQRSQSAQQFEQAAQPYMARIQSLGVTPNQAFEHLLRADYTLATGSPQQKAMLVDKMLQDYGVDIATLDQVIAARLGGSAAPATQQAPDIQQLVQQQLQQALAPIYQQQAAQQQQVAQQATQTVEQMALDPKYPYFDDVRDKMATIIESGLAADLPSAYNYAVSMTPELNRMNFATQSNQAAQRALAASASVSGSPVGGGSQVHVSGGDLRSDIEAAFGGARL
jgi:hypothetical protein